MGRERAQEDDFVRTVEIPRDKKAEHAVQQFRLTVVEGPDPGRTWVSEGETCSIGSSPANDLAVLHRNVSRFHCEVRIEPAGAVIRDLGSLNGTHVDGVRVRDAFLRTGSVIELAERVSLRFELGASKNRVPLSPRTQFGSLVSTSVPMRAAFALLERAAASDATVLLEGETGTGKTEAARALHAESARKGGPFVTVNCGAIPGGLAESELFGHERGAFSGALERRIGAFETASGGTIFLDEIGELPLDLQPKLLRVLEGQTFSRLGSHVEIKADARVVAATNRDLRVEANAGRFRSDLFYRLAVLRIVLPPLRQRPEDIPALVEHVLASLAPAEELAAALRAPELIDKLRRAAWRGNVRDLRAHLVRCVVYQDPEWPFEGHTEALVSAVDPSRPFKEARQIALELFEREYVAALLARHGGNVTQAAAAAGLARGYLHRVLRRTGASRE